MSRVAEWQMLSGKSFLRFGASLFLSLNLNSSQRRQRFNARADPEIERGRYPTLTAGMFCFGYGFASYLPAPANQIHMAHEGRKNATKASYIDSTATTSDPKRTVLFASVTLSPVRRTQKPKPIQVHLTSSLTNLSSRMVSTLT